MFWVTYSLIVLFCFCTQNNHVCVAINCGYLQVYHSGRSQWEEVAPMPRALTEFHCQLISFNRYRDPWGDAVWCTAGKRRDLWSNVSGCTVRVLLMRLLIFNWLHIPHHPKKHKSQVIYLCSIYRSSRVKHLLSWALSCVNPNVVPPVKEGFWEEDHFRHECCLCLVCILKEDFP